MRPCIFCTYSFLFELTFSVNILYMSGYDGQVSAEQGNRFVFCGPDGVLLGGKTLTSKMKHPIFGFRIISINPLLCFSSHAV